MLRCGQAGADAVEALERQNREFLETLAQIALRNAPNPFDERYDLDLLLHSANEDAEESERIRFLLAAYKESHGG